METKKKNKLRNFMRITHRYLGFFMAGIMMIYAISGALLVYRDTDFLKKDKIHNKVLEKNLSEKDLGKELKIKNFEILKTEGTIVHFKEGTYNSTTGEANYTKKELPFVLDKMNQLHKSPSKDKLGGLNVLFGFCLFFFVLSSFWMFTPQSKIFKKGMLYAIAGVIMALLLTFI